MPTRHLDRGTLRRFAASALAREPMLAAGRHLFTCAVCRAQLRREFPHGPEVLARLESRWRPQAGGDYDVLFDRIERSAVERVERVEHDAAAAPYLLAELMARPEIVRSDPRFWSPALVLLLLQSCQKVWAIDPARAEKIGGLALEILGRLDVRLHGSGLTNDLKARAWAFIGNARRISSELRVAEVAFKRAERFLEEGSTDPLERARVLDLKASLLRAQRRFATALATMDEVISIYRRMGDRHLEGRGLISKATILHYDERTEEGIPLLFRGLELIDENAEPRLSWVVYNNLVTQLTALGRLEEATRLLPEAERRAHAVGTVADRLRTLWGEAQLDVAKGRTSEAEGKLDRVRNGFVELRIGYDAALASLDLAGLYLEQGRVSETRALAAEMQPIFASRDVHREALAALLLFQRAAEQESATVLLVKETARRVRHAPYGAEAPVERPS